MEHRFAPVAVGGIGGSGTRLIAQLLRALGFYMGGDLNEAGDNLWFTLLFKRSEILSAPEAEFGEAVRAFCHGMSGRRLTPKQRALVKSCVGTRRTEFPPGWYKARAAALVAAGENRSGSPRRCWGWKEPNTHVVIDRLPRYLPGLRYIHVARNGLDMAYSANQTQAKLWGEHFTGRAYDASPGYALSYWKAVHARVLAVCRPMGERFWLLNFDAFCRQPEEGVSALTRFVGGELQETEIVRLCRHIRVPPSVGRYRIQGGAPFSPEDVAFVRSLGFDTNF